MNTPPLIRRDLRGMNLDQCVAAAESMLDAVFEQQLLEFELDMQDCGAAAEEVAALLDRQRAAYSDWRGEKIGELKVWLARGGETLN